MSRMLFTGGACLLAGMLALVGRSLSETKTPGPRLGTRVALVNLAQVLEGYQKMAGFSVENMKVLESFQEDAKALQMEMYDHYTYSGHSSGDSAQQKEIRRLLETWKCKVDDLTKRIAAVYGKRHDEQLVIVYQDILDAVERDARAHAVDLVLQYNRPSQKEVVSFGPDQGLEQLFPEFASPEKTELLKSPSVPNAFT